MSELFNEQAKVNRQHNGPSCNYVCEMTAMQKVQVEKYKFQVDATKSNCSINLIDNKLFIV